MTDLTVSELMTALAETEEKHTFIADSTGRMLVLESGQSPYHVNLEQLTFWSRGNTTKIGS